MITINIAKASTTLDVDFATLTPAVQDYVIRYGLTQILNDAHSQIKAGEPDAAAKAKALAVKKLDGLKAGEVRVARGESADPVEAEAMRLARLAVVAGIKAKGKKVSAYEPADILGASKKFYDQNKASLTAEAEGNLKKKAELAGGVDLADLGL